MQSCMNYPCLFSKAGFEIPCKLSPMHEMSTPIFLKKKNKKNVIHLLTAEYANSVVKVKDIYLP